MEITETIELIVSGFGWIMFLLFVVGNIIFNSKHVISYVKTKYKNYAEEGKSRRVRLRTSKGKSLHTNN